LSGVALAAVFTEWCRSFEALQSRMRDRGWDHNPAGCEVSRQALQEESSPRFMNAKTIDGRIIM